jgi:hypothetical protein
LSARLEPTEVLRLELGASRVIHTAPTISIDPLFYAAPCTGNNEPLSIIAPILQEAGKPSNCSRGFVSMSDVEQGENHAAMQQLKDEIRRLREQQSPAEKIAVLVDMTTDDAARYRERNNRIKSLTSQLAMVDSEQEVALQ